MVFILSEVEGCKIAMQPVLDAATSPTPQPSAGPGQGYGQALLIAS